MSTEHLVTNVGQVLQALIGHGNEPRKRAETYLQQLTLQRPGEVLLVLAQIGCLGVGGYQLEQRFLALILLRRYAFQPLSGLYLNSQARIDSSPFDVIPEAVRGRIETVICTGLQDETNVRVRKALGDCAAGWAEQSAKRQRPCVPLPPVMLQLVASREPFHRFTPFQLLSLCPTLLLKSMANPPPAEQLASLLVAGLKDPSVDVSTQAIIAVQKVLSDGVTLLERNEIGSQLVLATFEAVMRIPPDTMDHGLMSLLDLTQRYPKFAIPHLNRILPFLLALLSPPSPELPNLPWSPYPSYTDDMGDYSSIANLVSEMILTLVEFSHDKLLRWENGKVVKELPGLLMAWVVAELADEGEECEAWLNAKDVGELDGYPIQAEECLTRLGEAYADHDHVLQSLMQSVPTLLQHSDWRCRYIALSALAAVSDTQLIHLGDEIGVVSDDIRKLLEMILPFSRDPHPRVRHAFLHCHGLFMAGISNFVLLSHSIVPTLIHLLQDPESRVKAEACMTLEYYFDAKPKVELWRRYLPDLSQGLFQALTKSLLIVQEAAVLTINLISSDVVPVSKPFYRVFMGCVIEIIEKGTNPAQYELVARAANCAVALGRAAGKKTFSDDAVNLARVLMIAQNTIRDSSDPRSRAFFDVWCNFSRIMEEDFAPFLPHVLPPVLKSASYSPPETLEDDGDELGTAEDQEKMIAIDNLVRYARAMKGAFRPFVPQVLEIALDGMSLKHHDNVREVSPKLVTAMLQCAKDANDPGVINLERVFTILSEAIASAEYYSEIGKIVQCLTDCLDIIAMPLPTPLLHSVLKSINSILEDLIPQRQTRVEQQDWMDELQKSEEWEVERDEKLALDQMKTSLIALIKIQDEKGDVQVILDRVVAISQINMKAEHVE